MLERTRKTMVVVGVAALASPAACTASAPASSAERAQNGYGYEFEGDSVQQADGERPTAAPLDPAARVPPEAIQSAVRASFDGFRRCYEAGLARDPKLAGTVSVAFAFGEDGVVTDAKDATSTLPDAAVIGCVVGGFRQISFPKAHAGTVTVVYPIAFSPDD